MKAQRAFGVGRAAVHPEHRVEHPPDRADAVDDELARDLVRQVGQPTLTIGLPEPARAVRFEFGDEPAGERSEEHTSELPSLMRISYAVLCLKKKNTDNS